MCRLCNGLTEGEMRFLFRCYELNKIRIYLYHKVPQVLKHNEMYRLQLLLEKPHLITQYVSNLWRERTNILVYKQYAGMSLALDRWPPMATSFGL